jgi:XisI protein
MDKAVNNRHILLKVLQAYLDRRLNNPDTGVKTEAIFDRERDHYEIKKIGWRNGRRINFTVFHFNIAADGKIWVQTNASDYDIVGDLEESGVSKSDIVLAFHAPQYRRYTGYAIA